MHEVEHKLIAQVHEERNLLKKERDKTIIQLLKKLKDSEDVVIATDKTNSFEVVSTEKYINWVREHLKTSAKEIKRERLVEIFKIAQETKLELKDTLSEKELTFLSKTLESKSIPTPKLIIKDHKKANENGDDPSRLIVPANNFTSTFPRLGYLGIKKIFDAGNIDYEARTITQASTLKTELETLNLRK